MSEETQTQPQPPSMQLADLVTALEAMQVASSRGAFKPEEFTTIGACYERIYAFLVTSGAIKLPEQSGEGNQS